MSTEVAQGLREWAKGSYAAEAAIEMLIRAFGGRFAAAEWPWVVAREEVPRGSLRTDHWLDADELVNTGSTGALSGGEQLYLRFVGGMFGPTDLDLSDIARLDRNLQALVLAGLSHAGGSHQHPKMVTGEQTDAVTGETFEATLPLRGRAGPPLFPWPGGDTGR
ncbi:hypothetical protein MWU75_07175 [Ornithinimicrobium sp. F0845]|uniref:hypothetical protein n=1 Tax=Ornithinimicrobium sp. F0845 TaxID=2926412 RepID=UPI001FF1A8BB|nr:hypothetical protein [Ornithinimicrobium sp. F0845]MCK0111916.1 hypothetical protein [Ornithinimicrobium sp. F0845]